MYHSVWLEQPPLSTDSEALGFLDSKRKLGQRKTCKHGELEILYLYMKLLVSLCIFPRLVVCD